MRRLRKPSVRVLGDLWRHFWRKEGVLQQLRLVVRSTRGLLPPGRTNGPRRVQERNRLSSRWLPRLRASLDWASDRLRGGERVDMTGVAAKRL